MGAAAAAASLAYLPADRMAVALSYATQSASGLATLFRDPFHVEKAFVFGGLPARGGIEAAMMVQSGMTGVPDPLDGEVNFFQANNHQGDIAKAFATLGKPYEITRTNIKRWSVGSPAQAVMDALHALIVKYNIKPQDVVKAEVFLSPRSARVVDRRSMLDINVQYLSAVMLLDGTLSFEASHDFTRAKKPEVVNMLKKVTLLTDDKLGGEGQAKNPRQGAAAIYLKDGRRVYHHAKAVRGTAENPMTVEEVEAKAHDLIKPVLGARHAGAIVKTMASLDKAKSVDKLVALMQGK
jgi:2-methylcitrate dehydratase PrpD